MYLSVESLVLREIVPTMGKGGLRRKNTPEKQKKTATKPQGQESKGRLAFEELLEQTRITIAEDSRSGVSDLTSRAAS